MKTRINELKTLIKHISRKCKCKFNGWKYNWYQSKIKNCIDVSAEAWEKSCVQKNIMLWPYQVATNKFKRNLH